MPAARNVATGSPIESSITCPTFQVKRNCLSFRRDYNNSRSLRLAMKAVKEAMADAGIEKFTPRFRVGVCFRTTVASQLNNIAFYDAYRREGNPPLDAVYHYLNANLGKAVGDLLQVTGPRMTI